MKDLRRRLAAAERALGQVQQGILRVTGSEKRLTQRLEDKGYIRHKMRRVIGALTRRARKTIAAIE